MCKHILPRITIKPTYSKTIFNNQTVICINMLQTKPNKQ